MAVEAPAAVHLLLVEDEANLARTLAFNLHHEGYRVTVASDLAEARRAWHRHGCDLVLLDVMLPDGSGLLLARELRDAGAHVPILMLTARTAVEDVIGGLRIGADDYLGKPFALDELLSRIAALLRRQAWAADPKIVEVRHACFGGNRIDLETGAAETARGSIRLTEMEMRLLRHLLRHRGEDLTREHLLGEVWGLAVNRGARSRTLDTFILRLRKYFEVDPAEPFHFRTVYGIGYRFHPGQGATFTS